MRIFFNIICVLSLFLGGKSLAINTDCHSSSDRNGSPISISNLHKFKPAIPFTIIADTDSDNDAETPIVEDSRDDAQLGVYLLPSLSESFFKPLAETCQKSFNFDVSANTTHDIPIYLLNNVFLI